MSKNSSKNVIKKSDEGSNQLTVEETYKSMTDHEHILKKPGMYIGGIEEDNIYMWVFDSEIKKMVYRSIKYIPGLYKIFDEILINARDQKIRDKTCTEIRVKINEETGELSIWNNGENGIPVVIHKVEKCYVPEMIFSKIRTSSNYEQDKKIVGGTNGLGAKASNIYSTHFRVNVIDAKNKLQFIQNFYDNMYKKEEPEIIKLTGKSKSFTEITFTPDFKQFGVEGLSDDMIALFKKRVYDIAAVTNIKVTLNDEEIKIKDFQEYINMFYEASESDTLDNNDENNNENKIKETAKPTIYEQCNERWRVGVVFDPNAGYKQISYVNGICTFQGGSHVTYIVDQIVGGLYDIVTSKNKNLKIKKNTIRDNLTFFVDSIIEDPSFGSQTKELLASKVANFGSTCEVSQNFIKSLAKTGIIDEVVSFAEFRALKDLKKNDGKKKPNLKGIAKLNDATEAGSRNAKHCTLILTEGDSAKSFAVSGTEVLGVNRYGVFPLKGKLLNVREATAKQLATNEEIKNLVKIMGLKFGKKYTKVDDLRYGRILILTDQDLDGSHIKGLIINFVDYFWPSLSKIPGFIATIKTPIMKTWKKTDKKKSDPITFYTLGEYANWKDEHKDELYKYIMPPKYYKGLGTSTENEAKESFIDFEKKIIQYVWDDIKTTQTIDLEEYDDNDEDENNNDQENNNDDGSSKTDDNEESEVIDKTNPSYDAITLAFSKTRISDRKKWLKQYNKDITLDNNSQKITYSEFIHKDMIHFSNYDNIRSIPSVCDGFKPSIRKILYGSILRKIFKEEIKVSQLAGFVSDKAGYHHGEASLQGAIVGMAQDFVGSNNINWLLPNGAFGDRTLGGKNASSARYIFTQLNELVPLVFRDEDECILKHMDDDGVAVEPEVYAPIICNALINGSSGIGTGFSTDVPPFNPLDIIKNQKALIKGEKQTKMTPWFRNFTGKVITDSTNNNAYETHGIYDITDVDTIQITELPVGTWTDNYKSYLESLVADDPKNPGKGQILKKIIPANGRNTINFTITFLDGELQKLVKKGETEIPKKLKLINKHSMSNMNLYDEKGILKHYTNSLDILSEFYTFRLGMYEKRKLHYLKILENKLNIIGWKIKFLDCVINGDIIVFENKKARSKQNVIEQLEKKSFPKLSSNPDASNEDKTYDYLTGITIFALTDEERNKLKDEYTKKLDEFNTYKNTSIQDIWLNELNELETAYKKWVDENNQKNKEPTKKGKTNGNSKKKGVIVVKTKK
ncbi:DNA gyrase/topoisomerase IV [Indivirus ILV1]|uniref:DNA topoisomerase 2 n=1 Tax=Indivirus ILV1 TaxID=1977633 RepID=A0A1V0SCI9_9VIRU|nr:DNA gyrase/topoisomerase IV [Indivirus ILV1]